MSLEITDDQISAFPPEARTIIRALLARNAQLEKRVAELEAKLGKNSGNSSKPPSTEHPHAKPEPKKPKSKRRRGAQRGHRKFERTLIPTAECHDVVVCKPDECRCCGRRLRGTDPEPLRQQVWDVEIRPVVTEYQQHRLTCRGCGTGTCGVLPETVDAGGPGCEATGEAQPQEVTSVDVHPTRNIDKQVTPTHDPLCGKAAPAWPS